MPLRKCHPVEATQVGLKSPLTQHASLTQLKSFHPTKQSGTKEDQHSPETSQGNWSLKYGHLPARDAMQLHSPLSLERAEVTDIDDPTLLGINGPQDASRRETPR